MFMGSAALSCAALRRLAEADDIDLAGIVTQPPRPGGRRLALRPCPVQEMAASWGVPVFPLERVNAAPSLAEVRRCAPDVIVVVAYGRILSAAWLALPPAGCVNVHASLLPRYRGAAPIQWAIARGERETGVTTMLMDSGIDTGAVLLQRPLAILPGETAGELHERLADAGADLLLETLRGLREGSLRPTPQDHRRATYAPKLTKADGRIDWTLSAEEIYNRVRGFNPWPCCHCRLPSRPGARGKSLRVLAVEPCARSGLPGRVLSVSPGDPLVGAGRGALSLVRVQPEGGRSMSGAECARGHRLQVGAVLG